MRNRTWFLILSVFGIWPFCWAAVADRIILKDGTIEQSDHIWESDNYYHFILKGTKNVEIRYAKTIVERVERVSSDHRQRSVFSDQTQTDSASATSFMGESRESINGGNKGDSRSVDQTGHPDEQIIKALDGVAFYDPRRADRYWTTRQSKHSTLNKAVHALSEQYGRPSSWVETYMGEANDLGIIHRNLIARIKKEMPEGQAKELKGSTIDPIESMTAMPKINGHRDASELPIDVKPSVGLQQPDPGQGILFYDPRRFEKYWSGQMTRHNTFEEAVKALADQYHVSAEWVSSHMGETNDLAEIHRNIQRSLSAPSN